MSIARKIRARATYANVTATLALFIALGGTSYAVAALPRNSVGPAQLRPNAVGSSEIRKQAVRSSDIGNGAIRLRDVSESTRDALKGQIGPPGPQGPPGPTLFATINSVGGVVKGNVGSSSLGVGTRLVEFGRSITSCVATATLTAVAGDPNPAPALATIHAEPSSDRRIAVRTWDPAGAPTFYPFNLIVAC